MARPALARLTAQTRTAVIVAAPALAVVTVWAGLLVVAAATGTHPLWTLQPRNLAEAAAFRDGAAAIRRVEAEEDLNQPGPVREHIILPEPAMLTPIEAAAISGHTEMVQLLLDLGARPDAATWQRAFCGTDEDSIEELLAAHRPPGAADDCGVR